MKLQISEKLDLVKRELLSRYGDNIRCIFAMGSITEEGIKPSDLDVAVVFEDEYFEKWLDKLRPDLRDISAGINLGRDEYPLVLWASKVDHYLTWLPDVSYVRANLPYCFDSLDAWGGLAKNTLKLYEWHSHTDIYDSLSDILDGNEKIPAWESVEMFLLATRTLAQGLVEFHNKQEHIRRKGINHLAKAGLRACYSLMLTEGAPGPPSYGVIRDWAKQKLPAPFASIAEDLYLAKTGKNEKIDNLRLLNLMRYCESQVASVKRLTFFGVAQGSKGESFAYGADDLLESWKKKVVPPESYSRYVSPRVNHVHSLYFLTSASEIVRRFIESDILDGNILDFYFEELVFIFTIAMTFRGRLRIVLGRDEKETSDLLSDFDYRDGSTKLLTALADFYTKNQATNQCWLPERRKKTLTGFLLEAKETPLLGHKSALSALTDSKTQIEDFVDASSWYVRPFEGVFGWSSIGAITNIGRVLYEFGHFDAALHVLDKTLPIITLRQSTKDINFVTEQWPEDEQSISLKVMDIQLADALVWRGATLYRLGKIDDAKKDFLQALEYDGGNIRAIEGLNALLIEHSSPEKALSGIRECLPKCGEKIAEVTHTISTGYMNKAVELKSARKIAQAYRWYEQALAIDPNYAVVYHNFSVLQRENGDIQGAVKSLKRAIEIDPDYLNAYVNLGFIYENIDVNTSINLLTTAHNRGLGDENSFTNLGNCYYRIAKLVLAKEQFQKALGIKSSHADALNGMGIIYLIRATKNEPLAIQDALRYFEAAISADPAFTGAQMNYQKALTLSKKLHAGASPYRQNLVYPASSVRDALRYLVLRLDEIRHLTGSFICSGKTEIEITELTELILNTSNYGDAFQPILRQTQFKPTDDLIFRSNLIGVLTEPKSMDSVFVPRDQARSEFFLPYLLYAFARLDMNLESPQVQQELKSMGYDPANVRLAPMIEVVAGARDNYGAVGRENTISFSAEVSTDPLSIQCNFVFGLPLLATRPNWNGLFQPQQMTINEFAMKSLESDDDLKRVRDLFRWGSDKNHLSRFSQTHRAVLIPEKGIVYEKLRTVSLLATKKFVPQAFIIMPEDEVDKLFRHLLMAVWSINRREDIHAKHRIDGVLISEGGVWKKPLFIGANPITETNISAD